jgi:hypothetical protein
LQALFHHRRTHPHSRLVQQRLPSKSCNTTGLPLSSSSVALNRQEASLKTTGLEHVRLYPAAPTEGTGHPWQDDEQDGNDAAAVIALAIRNIALAIVAASRHLSTRDCS